MLCALILTLPYVWLKITIRFWEYGSMCSISQKGIECYKATQLQLKKIKNKKSNISSYRASNEGQEKERLVTQAQLGRRHNIGRNTGAPHFHIPSTLWILIFNKVFTRSLLHPTILQFGIRRACVMGSAKRNQSGWLGLGFRGEYGGQSNGFYAEYIGILWLRGYMRTKRSKWVQGISAYKSRFHCEFRELGKSPIITIPIIELSDAINITRESSNV